MIVFTAKGDIDSSLLTIKDIATLEGDCRVIKTQWFLGDELVRQDVWASILCPKSLHPQHGF